MILYALITIAYIIINALLFVLPNATAHPVPDLFKTMVEYGVNFLGFGTMFFSAGAWWTFITYIFLLFVGVSTIQILLWIYNKIPFLGR